MPRRFALVVLLCEDRQQECFAYRYLRHKGLSRYRIHVRKAPSAAGAAEQYVRQQYPAEVAALRAKAHSSAGLIAVLDVDSTSPQFRLNQLAEALQDAHQPPRAKDEPIAVLLPNRNIETWIHHLLGESVNEEDEYSKFSDEQRKCEPAVREFLRRCPDDMGNSLPSLQAACEELTRFFG